MNSAPPCFARTLVIAAGDCSGKSGFAMVYVTDGANVSMGFCSFIFLLCHSFFLQIIVILFFILAFTAILPHCRLAVNYVT